MDNEATYTIGRLAELAGVSAKTLRHYDRIGLLSPSTRSAAGYRLYSDADGRRLAEILAYRALQMSLADITALLGDADALHDAVVPSSGGRVTRLAEHLDRLRAQQAHLKSLIVHVEEMILHEEEGAPMSAADELNGFSNDPYKEEAQEKWGHTDAYQESARRVKNYTPEDWERYKEEAADINNRFVELMQADIPADSIDARALAEEHRLLISRWFYDCPKEMHANFGAMWEADPRFAENIDQAAPGLAAYMSAAFRT
ncbi:MAG: MerR family transcriptional regulator [Coriobacteriia bacterium]|nr:MerR family transcriptional regulator [Coriobacteriia bacterium]